MAFTAAILLQRMRRFHRLYGVICFRSLHLGWHFEEVEPNKIGFHERISLYESPFSFQLTPRTVRRLARATKVMEVCSIFGTHGGINDLV